MAELPDVRRRGGGARDDGCSFRCSAERVLAPTHDEGDGEPG